jgi:hypothetical protein
MDGQGTYIWPDDRRYEGGPDRLEPLVVVLFSSRPLSQVPGRMASDMGGEPTTVQTERSTRVSVDSSFSFRRMPRGA